MTCMSRSNPTCPELLLKSIWEQFVKSPRRRGESESSEGGGGIKDCFSLLLYRENIHLHCFSMTVALLPRCSQFEWFKFPCDVRVLLTAGHFLFFFFLDCMTLGFWRKVTKITPEAQSSPSPANTLAIRGRLALKRAPFVIHRQIKASRFPVNRLIIIWSHLPFYSSWIRKALFDPKVETMALDKKWACQCLTNWFEK